MPYKMWLLVLVTSFLLNQNCNADSSTIHHDGPIVFDSDLIAEDDNVEQRSSKADSMVKIASNMANARSIDEMMKQLQLLSRNFPVELFKDKSLKPFASKIKRNLDVLMGKAKPILQEARQLEKLGKKKSKKQLDAFVKKFKTLQSDVDRFTKTVNTESKKQRSRNLRIVNSNPNDATALESSKRFINVVDIFYHIVECVQSMQSKIKCFIFGNCDTSNVGGDDINPIGEEEYEYVEDDPGEVVPPVDGDGDPQEVNPADDAEVTTSE